MLYPEYLAALHRLPSITHSRLRHLLRVVESPELLWNSLFDHLPLLQLSPQQHTQLKSVYQDRLLQDTKKCIDHHNIILLREGEIGYPASLSHIAQSPYCLYRRGGSDAFDQPCIAVVGTRNPSPYGKQIVRALAKECARREITVVSGLALGIDYEIQKAVVEEGGKTIGVLGSGVDIIYPAQSRLLAKQMLETGSSIVSDFPIATTPEPYHFPMRNRLIAGLSQAVVVIEAGERSGSVITAQLGLEQGKDVYAFPGSIFSPQSCGTNQMIARGEAQLVSSIDELFQYLGYVKDDSLSVLQNIIPPSVELLPLYTLFGLDALEENTLYEGFQGDVQRFHAQLSLLELEGYIEKLPGNMWKKVE